MTPALSLVSLVLAIACLSGLNLYLTTFLAGMAVRFGWLEGIPLNGFAVLGHPAILTASFLLFLVEAVVDRIPWVDSLWDSVHTLIRPAGAVLLAWQGLEVAGPSWQTTGSVLAGLAALATHLTKSGIRLVINASPEPFTNILASTVEDLLVALLLLLTIRLPVTGLALCLALLTAVWLALPAMFRLVRSGLYLLWRRFHGSGAGPGRLQGRLPQVLSAGDTLLLAAQVGSAEVKWSVPCITGRTRGIDGLRSNSWGILASPADEPSALYFLTTRRFRRRAVRISLAGAGFHQETSFLSENLAVTDGRSRNLAVFRFPRPDRDVVEAVTGELRERTGADAPGLADEPHLRSGPGAAAVRSGPLRLPHPESGVF